MRQQTLVKVYF